MVGTGGIGSGTFFALSGDHTLGREESRGGAFLDRRDYCKLHIISHYVQRLMGSNFKTLPVGKVGDDEVGRGLLAEMLAEGMDLSLTSLCADKQTLNCICLLYPDGSGGNLTVTDSASGCVTAEEVQKAEPWFERYAGRGIALAVPEVPLAARLELLHLGGRHQFLRAASFSSEEMNSVREQSLLSDVDLLAINLDEAATLAGTNADGNPETIIAQILESLAPQHPHLMLSVTAGALGSYTWDRAHLHFLAPPKVKVQSAAGAGDAHFSGILAGLASGLPLSEAHQVGILTGAMSVTSPHTIHPDINRESLRSFATTNNVPLSAAVNRYLN